jgi:DHA1 family inner membrane transport protein
MGWRVPMLVIGAMALLSLGFIAVALPPTGADDGPPLNERLRAIRTAPVLVGLAAITLFWGASFTVYTYLVPLLEQRAGLDSTMVIVVLVIAGVCAVVGNVIGGRGADTDSRKTLLITSAITSVALLAVLPMSTNAVQTIAVVWQLAAWNSAACTAGKGGELAVSFAVSAFNIGIVAGAGFGGIALDQAGLPGVAVLGAVLSLVALGFVVLLVRYVTRRDLATSTAK